ncbi:MAG: hypothetical protein KA419_00085 [Acidobacteria bacterium]|nr:hypothetical protein [Acidobacteriota bacterium]
MDVNARRILLLAATLLAVGTWSQAETLYRIEVEHNHRSGECRGYLVVRDDKVLFESRTSPGCDRIIEYGAIDRVDVRSAYEFHLYFSDQQHGKGQKYVLKFAADDEDNRKALKYIREHAGDRVEAPMQDTDDEGHIELPYRLGVELDLNGNNCNGYLVLREDKIIFETGAVDCSNRAFIHTWSDLRAYDRVDPDEFTLTFYKYGHSAPGKVTTVRFWSKGGDIPDEVHRFLRKRARKNN